MTVASMAALPALYRSFETVRDAVARGFVPLGDREDALDAAPRRFLYPIAPMADVSRADVVASSAWGGQWMWIVAHQDGSPDELREEPVWCVDPNALQIRPWRTAHPYGLTLDQAMGYVERFVAHVRQHCIVIDGAKDGDGRVIYTLRCREWMELRDAFRETDGNQIDMFADPIQGKFAMCRRAIRDALLVRAVGPEDRVAIKHTMALGMLFNLVDAVNERRNPPAFVWEA